MVTFAPGGGPATSLCVPQLPGCRFSLANKVQECMGLTFVLYRSFSSPSSQFSATPSCCCYCSCSVILGLTPNMRKNVRGINVIKKSQLRQLCRYSEYRLPLSDEIKNWSTFYPMQVCHRPRKEAGTILTSIKVTVYLQMGNFLQISIFRLNNNPNKISNVKKIDHWKRLNVGREMTVLSFGQM